MQNRNKCNKFTFDICMENVLLPMNQYQTRKMSCMADTLLQTHPFPRIDKAGQGRRFILGSNPHIDFNASVICNITSSNRCSSTVEKPTGQSVF